MRNLTISLIVAAIALLSDLTAMSLLKQYRAAKEASAAQALPPRVAADWRKVGIERKFSLHVPPDMTPAAVGCGNIWPGKDYVNESLWVSYQYGENLPCNHYDLFAEDDRRARLVRAKVAGKSATLEVWRGRPDGSGMQICVPDIGDGKTRLIVAVRTQRESEQELAAAKQVIDSVRLP